jgi:hypothetical protein
VADAQVNLKLTPSEFDLIRRALKQHESNQSFIMKDTSTDPKLRHEARTELTLTGQLVSKLEN